MAICYINFMVDLNPLGEFEVILSWFPVTISLGMGAANLRDIVGFITS